VCDLKGKSVARLIRKVRPQLSGTYQNQFGTVKYDSQEEDFIKCELPTNFKLVMQNLHDPDAKRIRRYGHARGLSDSELWRFRIGYAPSLRGRMILPSFDDDGRLNYWTARRVDDDPSYRYLNAKVPKTQFIVGELDLDWGAEEIILVEGPFDLIKCSLLNATCLLGSTLNENSTIFRKLITYPERIVLALDSDARKKQDKIANLLMSYDKEVYYVTAPEEEDWGDMNPIDVYNQMQTKHQYTSNTKLMNMIQDL
jgi:DNA primase